MKMKTNAKTFWCARENSARKTRKNIMYFRCKNYSASKILSLLIIKGEFSAKAMFTDENGERFSATYLQQHVRTNTVDRYQRVQHGMRVQILDLIYRLKTYTLSLFILRSMS